MHRSRGKSGRFPGRTTELYGALLPLHIHPTLSLSLSFTLPPLPPSLSSPSLSLTQGHVHHPSVICSLLTLIHHTLLHLATAVVKSRRFTPGSCSFPDPPSINTPSSPLAPGLHFDVVTPSTVCLPVSSAPPLGSDHTETVFTDPIPRPSVKDDPPDRPEQTPPQLATVTHLAWMETSELTHG